MLSGPYETFFFLFWNRNIIEKLEKISMLRTTLMKSKLLFKDLLMIYHASLY